jgi:pilus assembly protein Flp/PilA
MKNLIKRFIRNEEGQDLIEYALLIVLIAIVVIASLRTLGPAVAGVYDTITAEFPVA